MADVLPHSVVYSLPVMSFRGLDAPPYDVAGFGFGHSHGERVYPYIDGAAFDWTGLDPQRLGFTLYFLNTLEPGAFPDAYNEWWRELQDGEPGEMVHPLLGPRQVVVRDGDVQLTARNTAGVIVSVNFSTAILDPEDVPAAYSVALNVSELAATAIVEASAAGVSLPSETSATDITQAADQISGLMSQFDMAAAGLIGKFQKTAGDMIGLAELAGHGAYKARDAAITLWAALEDLGEQLGVEQARTTSSTKVTNDTTLDAFAREHGNTLAEIVGLNPDALASPTVERGTTLVYYT